MKINNFSASVLLFILIVITSFRGYSQNDSVIKNKKAENIKLTVDSCHKVQTVYYTCPVHQKVRLDRAGNCPQCGITMDKKRGVAYYSCPIHSEVQHEEEGNCEKCGSGLQKKSDP